MWNLGQQEHDFADEVHIDGANYSFAARRRHRLLVVGGLLEDGGQPWRRLVASINKAQLHVAVVRVESVLREPVHFTHVQLRRQRRQV